MKASPDIHLIHLYKAPIFKQLQLEEALLRTDEKNYCIINEGSPPSIVMGISADMHRVVDLPIAEKKKVPLIRRFSGGGTVLVGPDTLFVSFILGKSALALKPFPEPILRWNADFYAKAWNLPDFQLRENDYCIGDKKFGGNAQYITKNRWTHHTCFLWDYSEGDMDVLLLPERRPKYRLSRPHKDFLVRLRAYAAKKSLVEGIYHRLYETFGSVKKQSLESLPKIFPPHRKATQIIRVNDHRKDPKNLSEPVLSPLSRSERSTP